MNIRTLLAIIFTLSALTAIAYPVVVFVQALQENTLLLSPSLFASFLAGLLCIPACVHAFRRRNISYKSMLAHESTGFLIAGTYYRLAYLGWQNTPSVIPEQGLSALSCEEAEDEAATLGHMVTIMGALFAEARHSGRIIDDNNGQLRMLLALAEKHEAKGKGIIFCAAEIAMEALLARRDMLLPLAKRVLDKGAVYGDEVWRLWNLTGQRKTDRREIQKEIKRIAPSLSYA